MSALVIALLAACGNQTSPTGPAGPRPAGQPAQPPADSASVPVTPASWPNEPAGLGTITNNSLDTLDAAGWRTSWNDKHWVTAAHDAQRGKVIRWDYPAGFTGGRGPGMEYYEHAPAKEVYAGFWWKPSDPWQTHPGSHVNKIAFWYTTSTGRSMDLQMYGSPPYQLHVVSELTSGGIRMPPNVTPSTVTLGVWHRIEWHLKYASSSGGSDGLVEWWMDGVLQGRYTNVQTPSDAGYAQYQISPTWGGVDGVKSENDYFLYDEIHLSGR